jgi:signal transduction histidine kinase
MSRHTVTSTVRFRVTALATGVVVVVLVGIGFALVTNQRRVLTETLDESLTARVDEIEPLIASGETPSLTNLGEDDTVAQIVSAGGDVLASSPLIEGLPPIGGRITAGQTIGDGEPLPSIDGDVRLLSRFVETRNGDVIVYLAASTDDINDSVTTLITSLTVAVPLAAGILAALIWLLVGRTLRPVEQIRVEVAAIGGTELHRRVPVPPGDDEIVRLARTMNDMLQRVDEASGRQRRFIADASHELRSPLTRMRSELEVDLAHPDRADPVATHDSVLEEVIGLQRLVDDLLLLARNSALTASPADRQDLVDLCAIADRVGNGITVKDGFRVEVHHDGRSLVRGNAAELARAITNLADNATRHARSVVRLTISSAAAAVTLAVEDDGHGIPPGEHERIFERFARLDEGRAVTDGGTGLGLAIARDIIERHGGTVTVDTAYRKGARFVITLPAAHDTPVAGSSPPINATP